MEWRIPDRSGCSRQHNCEHGGAPAATFGDCPVEGTYWLPRAYCVLA